MKMSKHVSWKTVQVCRTTRATSTGRGALCRNRFSNERGAPTFSVGGRLVRYGRVRADSAAEALDPGYAYRVTECSPGGAARALGSLSCRLRFWL